MMKSEVESKNRREERESGSENKEEEKRQS